MPAEKEAAQYIVVIITLILLMFSLIFIKPFTSLLAISWSYSTLLQTLPFKVLMQALSSAFGALQPLESAADAVGGFIRWAWGGISWVGSQIAGAFG